MQSLLNNSQWLSQDIEEPPILNIELGFHSPSTADNLILSHTFPIHTPSTEPALSFPHQANTELHHSLVKKTTKLRSGNRVPRPRNAFMIFRSEFWAAEKINKEVERDHRHISRIIGHCWNQLPEEEKDRWRHKADQEKTDHRNKYPGYRFSPATRTKKPVKRNVRRNGKNELLRCKQVAELLLSGKQGDELHTAVLNMDLPLKEDFATLEVTDSDFGVSLSSRLPKKFSKVDHAFPNNNETPIFRSPLLPPAAAPKDPPPQYFFQSPLALPNMHAGRVLKRPEEVFSPRYSFPRVQNAGEGSSQLIHNQHLGGWAVALPPWHEFDHSHYYLSKSHQTSDISSPLTFPIQFTNPTTQTVLPEVSLDPLERYVSMFGTG